MKKPVPTRERVCEVLNYDHMTGVFTWRAKNRRVFAGDIAGWVEMPSGHRRLGLDGWRYFEHQIAWLLMHNEWPCRDIDHINGVRADNRIANLRLATPSQNQANAKKFSTNTSGYKGVSKTTNHGRLIYKANIMKDGVPYRLGYFKDPRKAHEAYVKKAIELFGEFARFE